MPPRPQKQLPPKTQAQTRTTKSGSILDQAVDVTELGADSYIKLCLYGQNRVGKTTLACQFEKPLLLVSFEPHHTGGAQSVRSVEGVKLVRITESKQSFQLVEELKATGNIYRGSSAKYNGKPYKTHVIDSATSVQDILLREIMGPSTPLEQLNWGSVSRDEYGDRSERTRVLLRPWTDMQCHTVVIALEKENRPRDYKNPELVDGLLLKTFISTDLGEGMMRWLFNTCDYICRLYIDDETVEKTYTQVVNKVKQTTKVKELTGRRIRRLRTTLHPNYAAGFRSSKPAELPEIIDNPTYAKIVQYMG